MTNMNTAQSGQPRPDVSITFGEKKYFLLGEEKKDGDIDRAIAVFFFFFWLHLHDMLGP